MTTMTATNSRVKHLSGPRMDVESSTTPMGAESLSRRGSASDGICGVVSGSGGASTTRSSVCATTSVNEEVAKCLVAAEGAGMVGFGGTGGKEGGKASTRRRSSQLRPVTPPSSPTRPFTPPPSPLPRHNDDDDDDSHASAMPHNHGFLLDALAFLPYFGKWNWRKTPEKEEDVKDRKSKSDSKYADSFDGNVDDDVSVKNADMDDDVIDDDAVSSPGDDDDDENGAGDAVGATPSESDAKRSANDGSCPGPPAVTIQGPLRQLSGKDALLAGQWTSLAGSPARQRRLLASREKKSSVD